MRNKQQFNSYMLNIKFTNDVHYFLLEVMDDAKVVENDKRMTSKSDDIGEAKISFQPTSNSNSVTTQPSMSAKILLHFLYSLIMTLATSKDEWLSMSITIYMRNI